MKTNDTKKSVVEPAPPARDPHNDINPFGEGKPRYRDRRYRLLRNDHAIDRDDKYRDDPIRSMELKTEIPEFTGRRKKEFDEEEAYGDLQMSKQYGNESQNSAKSDSSCSIISESDNLAEQENAIKDHELKKVRRKNNGGSANAILDSIIKDKDIHGKENDECIPLKFKFDDSDDDSSSQATNDPDLEGVFQEMGFLLEEAIDSYRTPTPTAESEGKDDYNDDTKTSVFKLYQRGDHKDVYLEEQTGMRCHLCGVVLVESKYVIPKLANIKPDKLEARSYRQLPTSTNLNFKDSDCKYFEICKQTRGTVQELIPTRLQEHMYPHKHEGFNFLWENLAGTAELSGLQKLDKPSSGGCIISHGPAKIKKWKVTVMATELQVENEKVFKKIIDVLAQAVCLEEKVKHMLSCEVQMYEFEDVVKGALSVAKSWLTKAEPFLESDLGLISV
nr:SNF2 domain-containing protein CLASSY 3-like [Tanacetum cinerariifolium]